MKLLSSVYWYICCVRMDLASLASRMRSLKIRSWLSRETQCLTALMNSCWVVIRGISSSSLSVSSLWSSLFSVSLLFWV